MTVCHGTSCHVTSRHGKAKQSKAQNRIDYSSERVNCVGKENRGSSPPPSHADPRCLLTSCSPGSSTNEADGSRKSRMRETSPRGSEAKICRPAQLRITTTNAFRVAWKHSTRDTGQVSATDGTNHHNTREFESAERIQLPWSRMVHERTTQGRKQTDHKSSSWTQTNFAMLPPRLLLRPQGPKHAFPSHLPALHSLRSRRNVQISEAAQQVMEFQVRPNILARARVLHYGNERIYQRVREILHASMS